MYNLCTEATTFPMVYFNDYIIELYTANVINFCGAIYKSQMIQWIRNKNQNGNNDFEHICLCNNIIQYNEHNTHETINQ